MAENRGDTCTSLPEHATHLKHEATTLLDFANGKAKDSKLKKTVQWSYIEAFVVSLGQARWWRQPMESLPMESQRTAHPNG